MLFDSTNPVYEVLTEKARQVKQMKARKKKQY
jgi:hypothetical protein